MKRQQGGLEAFQFLSLLQSKVEHDLTPKFIWIDSSLCIFYSSLRRCFSVVSLESRSSQLYFQLNPFNLNYLPKVHLEIG